MTTMPLSNFILIIYSLLFYFYTFGILHILAEEPAYFAKSHDTVVLPINFPVNETFYEAYLVHRTSDTKEPLHVALSVNRMSPLYSSIALKQDSMGTGVHLILSKSLQPSFSGNGTPGELAAAFCLANPIVSILLFCLNDTVAICLKYSGGRRLPSCINLTILISPVDVVPVLCQPSVVCFGASSDPVALTVFESSLPSQKLILLNQTVYKNVCIMEARPSFSLTWTQDANKKGLEVNEGIITLNGTILAGDKISTYGFNVGCDVVLNGTKYNVHKEGTVNVIIKNEHGPVPIENPRIIINMDKNFRFEYKLLTVQDNDIKLSPYRVELYDDPLKLFSYSVHENFAVSAWIITARIRFRDRRLLDFPGNTYTFRVRFVDTTLRAENVSKEVIYTVTFNKPGRIQSTNPDALVLDDIVGKEFNASVFRNAAINSRVVQPIDTNASFHAGVHFYLKTVSGRSESPLPFNVTPSEGIVYVNDTVRLEALNGSRLLFKLGWKSKSVDKNDTYYGYIWIDVQLEQSTSEDRDGDGPLCGKDAMCSMHASELDCSTSCGLGASRGHCQWRNATRYRYATCTPQLNSCPDKVCDELERTFYHICPQDCVESSNVHGTYFGNGESTHGISQGRGICTCDTHKKCSCDFSNPMEFVSEEEENGLQGQGKNPRLSADHSLKDNATIAHNGAHSNPIAKDEVCGKNCIIIISGFAFLFIFILVFCVLLILKRSSNLRRRHKYPNRDGSLPAVPSDYFVDERSSSVVSQNIVLQDILAIANKIPAIESKWEFSRSKLILQQTLGEGEFGRVMRAKALDINGQPGYTTVAVKMSKCHGSSAELDLLQEFNLLKEVVHQNVIRVLGACSACKDGPLFIIVEYAEFGSLRVYLRKSRRLEFKSCTSDDSGVDSMANGNQIDHHLSDYQVNPRDLLQFAWQIARGMAYLSEMKLIHRDLAARNILVASGKVVKISDFGLTRDVYEGDAYFKKSMGRVPVKWMAIESLLDHVYTTKSDVWSFGIVLWEIVTLGAAPYPGVLPETLYHLLKSGYRMEKPDNCSDELYKIMLRCWHEFPHERPSFVELTKIFDEMLQANVEYLDLGIHMVHNLTYFEDMTGQTDTIGEESEMGYGSWNALPTDDSDYLQSNSRSNAEDEEVTCLLNKLPCGMTTTGGKDDTFQGKELEEQEKMV